MAPEVRDYDPGDRAGVEALFVDEYGAAPDLGAFYDHPFQAGRAVRVVASEGQRIVGFQSFFHWPLRRDDDVVDAHQSGRTLVAAPWRGAGLFGRMLRHADRSHASPLGLIIGFPVPAALAGFLRAGWSNPFDLEWSGRAVPPRPWVTSPRRPALPHASFDTTATETGVSVPGLLVRDHSPAFEAWREAWWQPAPRFVFRYVARGDSMAAEIKVEHSGSVAVIGDVRPSTWDVPFLVDALRALLRLVGARTSARVVTIAVNRNSRSQSLPAALRAVRFAPLRRRIPFVVRLRPGEPTGRLPGEWHLLRSDMDTW